VGVGGKGIVERKRKTILLDLAGARSKQCISFFFRIIGF
jgi:hypothetical protein